MDEPASALNFHNQDVILSTIRQVCQDRGLTVVFASHYPNMRFTSRTRCS
jgi:iron complex transport system ATP-binding protein